MTDHPPPGDRLLRLTEVEVKTGLRSSSIYRRIAEGSFPRGVKLGELTVRWRLSEIDKWIAELPAAGRGRGIEKVMAS